VFNDFIYYLLFNQIIIELDTHEIDWIKLKRKKYYERLHILEILSKNKYFLILNLNFIIQNKKKTYRWIKIISLKLNTYKIINKTTTFPKSLNKQNKKN